MAHTSGAGLILGQAASQMACTKCITITFATVLIIKVSRGKMRLVLRFFKSHYSARQYMNFEPGPTRDDGRPVTRGRPGRRSAVRPRTIVRRVKLDAALSRERRAPSSSGDAQPRRSVYLYFESRLYNTTADLV